MFPGDHSPPHFHALYAEFEAVIDLRDLRVMRGTLPNRATALVLEWASQHHDELCENWERCERLQAPKRIDPLS